MSEAKHRHGRGGRKTSPERRNPIVDAEARVLAVIRRIPRGRVCSYGEIARLAGLPRRARLVGTVLKKTDAKVPWQRVINSQGKIAFPEGSDAHRRQQSLLKKEGVVFRNGRVDLQRYAWPSRDQSLDRLLCALRRSFGHFLALATRVHE